MVGKTLQNGSEDIFVVVRTPQEPYTNAILLAYIHYATQLGIDMTSGPLFRNQSWSKGHVSTERLSATAASYRFHQNMVQASIYEGETLYGCRSGQGLASTFGGMEITQVMDKIGWRTRKTAERYLKLRTLLGDIYSLEEQPVETIMNTYHALNKQEGLTRFA
jgi:hypothetical protein